MRHRASLILSATTLAAIGVPLFLLVNGAMAWPAILAILVCNVFCVALLVGVVWKGNVIL